MTTRHAASTTAALLLSLASSLCSVASAQTVSAQGASAQGASAQSASAQSASAEVASGEVASAQAVSGNAPAPRVFIVGDSHVQMLGPMLSRQLTEDGFDVVGYEARPGWSSLRYQRAGDLTELLEAHGRPEVVVVSLGGNDLPASREHYRAHLTWVVAQARAAGARQLVWLGPATSDVEVSERAAVVGARHEQNAEWQAELLPALGVRWIDSRPCTHEHHGRDGVHFTRRGYRSWLDGVVTHVEGTATAAADATPNGEVV